MMLSKRTIPRVASASLVLGGGCGGDGGGSSVGDVTAAVCDSLVGCGVYDSAEACLDERGAEIEANVESYDELGGAACGDALLDYYDCLGAEFAEPVCDFDTAFDACAGTVDQVGVVCDLAQTPTGVALDFCLASAECNAEFDVPLYDCWYYYTEAFAGNADDLEANYGAACAEAWLADRSCIFNEYQLSCDETDAATACEDAYDAYVEECGVLID
jgi:hypothetical protein